MSTSGRGQCECPRDRRNPLVFDRTGVPDTEADADPQGLIDDLERVRSTKLPPHVVAD